MNPLWIALSVLGAGAALFIGQVIYLSTVLTWSDQKTRGLGYYGLPPAERERFKRTLRWHARLLYPILRLISRTSRFTFAQASFEVGGITGPKGTCTPESFQRALSWTPEPTDIVVATQMKCGTTWMQHIVYEVLLRGNGNIVESGTTMYAISPWLEAVKSVPLEQAPVVGTERPGRIIKTHMPAPLLGDHPDARFIYVARHPVSCFASCADFVATNIGAAAPPLSDVEEWFCSDAMWWGGWPAHVKGWWQRARERGNVLFLYFEDMKRDLPGTIRRVADFLGMQPLSDDEVARIAEKTGFAYMQKHKDAFEMHPPHLLQTDAEMFRRGTADRYKDVPPGLRQRILAWCTRELQDSDFPAATVYPDIPAAREARSPAPN